MARSYTTKAENRTVVTVTAIRDALAEGDSGGALTLAVQSLRSEAAKARRHRPAEGTLIDAQLAGLLKGIAACLHAYRPSVPEGCSWPPGPDDLLAVFAAQLEQTVRHYSREAVNA